MNSEQLNIDTNTVKCHMRYIKRTSKDPHRDIDHFKNWLRLLSRLRSKIRLPQTPGPKE